MHALHRRRRLRILLPPKQASKREMLHDGELAQDLGVEHLDHALVDLSPAVLDAGHVEQDRAVFPEGALLDVVDETDGGEVQVFVPVALDGRGLGDVSWFGGARDRTLEGRGFVWRGDGARVLC